MILTTTNTIEGKKIVDYLGIVTGSVYNSSYYYEGNAVVGITLDVEPVANSGTLLVSITGTAVKVR